MNKISVELVKKKKRQMSTLQDMLKVEILEQYPFRSNSLKQSLHTEFDTIQNSLLYNDNLKLKQQKSIYQIQQRLRYSAFDEQQLNLSQRKRKIVQLSPNQCAGKNIRFKKDYLNKQNSNLLFQQNNVQKCDLPKLIKRQLDYQGKLLKNVLQTKHNQNNFKNRSPSYSQSSLIEYISNILLSKPTQSKNIDLSEQISRKNSQYIQTERMGIKLSLIRIDIPLRLEQQKKLIQLPPMKNFGYRC